MYCPGFCGEPTSDGDEAARCLRVWYEAHREGWSDRHLPFGENFKLGSAFADEFMLGMLNEVDRINSERDRQNKTRSGA